MRGTPPALIVPMNHQTSERLPEADIKRVPHEAAVRRSVRAWADEYAARLDRSRPPGRVQLEEQAAAMLERIELPGCYLGFAMVALSNSFWRNALQSIPFGRRVFLLPHCLSHRGVCGGTYDSVGLHCAGCGGCDIHSLQAEAEQLGYKVIVAEGTSSVLMSVLEGQADGIVGVACLDSLEKSFQHVVELGVPHAAVPLLRDGCTETAAELDEIRSLLRSQADGPGPVCRSCLPLLRETAAMFQEPLFSRLLAPCDPAAESPAGGTAAELEMTPRAARDWLREGGKRLRPFVTLAAYAVARHGLDVLHRADGIGECLPDSVRRLALAIEAMHKASLVHDDIEDDDGFRYGRQTLHRVHGIGPAVNIGDYLIGLGYRLVASESASLGAECVADILAHLAHAHLELCRGQGTELLWQQRPEATRSPLEVLTVYALKTAPAFEVAIQAGLRAAGHKPDADLLRRFACYLGEGFQILNDLEDWRADARNKRTRGQDAIRGRPTVLRSFAARTDGGRTLAGLAATAGRSSPEDLVERLAEFYQQSGAWAQAEALLNKLRAGALDAAAGFATADIREMMAFLVRLVLPEQAGPAQP